MIDPDPSSLTEREQRFVEAFLETSSASAAALAAGYNPMSARGNASKVRWRPRVAAAIAAAQKARVERCGVTTDHVVKQLVAIAFADPSELVQHRRVACRHCWGIGHLHHYTAPEQAARREKMGVAFTDEGGEGFDRWADPSPDCPECQGYGVGEVIVNDTRLLSEEGRALFAGIRKTVRGGIEVKMHDRVAALALLGKQLGMFADRAEPLEMSVTDMYEIIDAKKDAFQARSELNAHLGLPPPPPPFPPFEEMTEEEVDRGWARIAQARRR